MRAVIYARYSSDSQREESIEGQIRECTEFAKRNNYTILYHYIDRALSARSADRPEFQHMIIDSEQRLFDIVLVWKFDRFSRDRHHSALYKHILKTHGVKVVSATENISNGPEGIILESMLEGMAEYYSLELKKKVERGHKENALKCKSNGGTVPYGYFIDHETHALAVHAEHAAVVREIFDNFDKGTRIVEIVQDLNRRGILCSYGHPFTKERIRSILRNRRYLGEYKYGDIVVPDGIPAIIDQKLFDKVNKKLDERTITQAASKARDLYILSRKFYCGICGSPMIGECGTGHYKGQKHYYYKCSASKRHSCDNRSGIKKDWIERASFLVTISVVLNDKTVERIADAVCRMQQKEDPAVTVLRDQLTDCEKRITNLTNAIEQGVLTPTTSARLEELEQNRNTLLYSISQLETKEHRLSRFEIASRINRYRFSDIEDKEFQKEVIGSFLNSIFCFGDRYVFTYNSKSKAQVLTLDEIKTAFDTQLKGPTPDHSGTSFVYLKDTFGFVISKDGLEELYLKYNS